MYISAAFRSVLINAAVIIQIFVVFAAHWKLVFFVQ